MAKNNESLNDSLFQLLRSRGYDPTLLGTDGKELPVPEEAEVFQFRFMKGDKDYGPVTISIDGLSKLVVYYGDEVASSPSGSDNTGQDTWYSLLNHLKRFSQQHQLSFELKDTDHLKYDMAKRTNMKKIDEAKWRQGYSASGHPAGYKHKSGEVGPVGGTFTNEPSGYDGETKKVPVQKHRDKEDELSGRAATKLSTTGKPLLPKNAQRNLKGAIKQSKGKHGPVGVLPEGQLAEGYYATGRKSSYSDAVPQVKIILQHSRQLEEGERRYRAIERIFVENANGERFLLNTTKPGLARVYARHIAEGGTPYDEQGKHIQSLCEEYTKMAGFVRATRNGQFNESTQSLVTEGVNHYNNLRETLHKMAGHRGYNAYFESWTPTLTEDEDSTDLSEMFASTELDPRIESVMPILRKLNKNITEVDHSVELAEWADEVIDESLGLVEVSNELLGRYKKAAGKEASGLDAFANAVAKKGEDPAYKRAADWATTRANKRFSGVVKATNKEFANDAKEVDETAYGQAQDDVQKWQAQPRASEQPALAKSKPWVLTVNGKPKCIDQNISVVKAAQAKLGGAGTIGRQGAIAEGDGLEALNTEGIPESEFAGKFKTGKAGQWTNKGPKANKPAQVGDLVGACESVEDTGNDRLYGYPAGSENSRKFRQYRKEAEYYCAGPGGKVLVPAARYHIQQRVRGMDKGQAEVLTAKNFGDEINSMYEATKKPDFAKKFQKNLDQTKKKADDTKEKVEQHQKEVKEDVDHLAHIIKLSKG